MIKVALIGVSSYGRVHLKMIEHMVAKQSLQLVAVTVINQKEEAELCRKLELSGCELFCDYEEMLRVWHGRLDLCMIPTPIFLHEQMTIAALKAGANVLVEKPMAAETSACRAMMEQADAVDRFVAVGFQKMYSRTTRKIKRDLLAGAIGDLREIRGITLWPRGTQYFSRNVWAGRVKVGDQFVLDSPVSNAAAHFLHLMMYWAGKTQDSVASIVDGLKAEMYRANDIENFDTASLRGRTHSGLAVSFVTSHASEGSVNPIIRVIGTKGEIEWVKDEGAYYRIEGEPERRIDVSDGDEEVRMMIEELVGRIQGDKLSLCTPEQALPHVEVVERLYQNFETSTIPANYIKEVKRDGNSQRVVPGMESIAREAFDKGILLSEAGAPWKASTLSESHGD